MASQNINRVDHVLYIARAENQAAYVEQLAKLCNVRFHGPVDKPDLGVRLYISWTAGLEVISPVSETAPWSLHMKKYIEDRGEGLMGVVFGVADIDAARAHADGLGYRTSEVIENDGTEPYATETEAMKETVVGDIINTMFVFGEIRLSDDALI